MYYLLAYLIIGLLTAYGTIRANRGAEYTSSQWNFSLAVAILFWPVVVVLIIAAVHDRLRKGEYK
jgi:hypothetical protein